jgi:hypothetical protein
MNRRKVKEVNTKEKSVADVVRYARTIIDTEGMHSSTYN